MRLGRYETLRPIASGGMATVHLARALGAGGFERLVAIKVLHPHIASEPDFVAMFLDEARLAASIRHPNVVATIDVQEDPLFLVMDYVEGPSLHLVQRELKKRGERLPLDVALRVFLDALAGLHAAHELVGADGQPVQLIHRDVSPHNLLLGADGVTRITDFGVARAASRLSTTRGGQVKGKLAYMAPEQIAAEVLDRRVDVYAAGVVLWEMLTNQPLYRGDSDAAVLAQVLSGPAKRPRELFPEIPEAVDDVCLHALRKARAERYASAADFADALEDAARASGVAIASPRAVAALVKRLDIHEAAPATGSAPLDASSPGSISSRQAAPSSGRVTSSPELPSAQTTTSVGTLVTPAPRPSAAAKVRMAAIVGGVAVVVVGLGLALRSSRGDTAPSAATASKTGAAATTASSAELPVPAPSASPSATAAASAQAASAASASSAAQTKPAPTGKGTGTSAGTARPRSTAFRPGDL